MIDVQGHPPEEASARFGAFACAAWEQNSALLAGAKLRAALAGDWQSAYEPDRFNCSKLTLQSGARTWLLLDGEVIAFDGAVELRYLPKAVQTFAFAAEDARSNTSLRNSFRRRRTGSGNRERDSHVRIEGAGSRRTTATGCRRE